MGGQNFARYLCIKSNQGDTPALHKLLAKGGPSQESAFNVSHGDLGHAVFWAKDSRTVEFCELNKFGALPKKSSAAIVLLLSSLSFTCTEIGKKTWQFAKLLPGRARKRINAT